jgi:hypothetical protein
LALIIAYWQWRTANDKLRLDHFDRRFTVHNIARNLLATIMTTGRITSEDLYKFGSGVRETKWLLNDDIDNYFQNQLWKNANKLLTLLETIDSLPSGQERTNNVNKQAELREWFQKQYIVLDTKFSPFLKLK